MRGKIIVVISRLVCLSLVLTFLTELSLDPAGTCALKRSDAGATILTTGMTKGWEKKKKIFISKKLILRDFSLTREYFCLEILCGFFSLLQFRIRRQFQVNVTAHSTLLPFHLFFELHCVRHLY